METRLARELDFKLIDAYLKLESSQLGKPKISELFGKVIHTVRVGGGEVNDRQVDL